MGIILALSTIPMAEVGFAYFSVADAVGHAVFYMVLAALAVRARAARSRVLAGGAAVLLAVAYGGALEVAQAFVSRDPSLSDWIADGIGAVIGAALALAWTDMDEEPR